MNFRSVIFDMDGVLIDSEPLWEEAETQLLESMGVRYEPSPSFTEKIVGLSQTDSSKLIIKQFGLSCSSEQLISGRIENLLRIYDEKLMMFEGAKAAIAEMRKLGLQTALASSSPMNVIKYVLEKFSIARLFDAVVSGDCVKNGKPEPDIYLLAAEKLILKPSECVAIEDSPAGVKSAVSAGMFCIAVPDKRLNPDEFKICDMTCGGIMEAGKAVAEML